MSEIYYKVFLMFKQNPELEARCQRLRNEQANKDYAKMTKNIDPRISVSCFKLTYKIYTCLNLISLSIA